MTELAFPKPRPRALEKQDRVKRKEKVEDRENALVKARSKGQCEVRQAFTNIATGETVLRRCAKPIMPGVHHLIGGSGRRGVRESALACNKLAVCFTCHDLITRRILQQHWQDVNDRAGTSYFIRLK